MIKIGRRAVLMVFPDRVEARVFTSGWLSKPDRLLAKSSAEVDEENTLGQAVRKALDQLAQRGLKVDVVVSDVMSRSLAVKRPRGVADATELRTSLVARFGRAFGDDVDSWALSFDMSPVGKNDILCAMPRELLDDVKNSISEFGLRVGSIRPLWVWCVLECNFRRNSAPNCLIVSDGYANTISVITQRSCVGVRTARRREGDLLHQVLARKSVVFEEIYKAQRVLVFGVGFNQPAVNISQNFSVLDCGWPRVWSGAPVSPGLCS